LLLTRLLRWALTVVRWVLFVAFLLRIMLEDETNEITRTPGR
jgi:hypothetical protein